MESVVKRIEDMFLTKSETVIADFIIENLDTVGLLTSHKLAQAVDVSDTSVIRFVHKLGYPTYAQFRNDMNGRISATMRRGAIQPESEQSDREMVGAMSSEILSSLTNAFTHLDDACVQKVVDVLMKSRHKYIAGFHTTAGCAQYMATRLVKLVPHVIPVTNADASSVETILDIGPEDCLIVYTFLKHSKINAPLMTLARQNGAKIILITDRPSTPLTHKADVTLLTRIRGSGSIYSFAAPLVVSEILLMTMLERSGSDGESRMHRLESILDNTDLF